MSHQLQPDRVELQDVWTWAIQAAALGQRRPVLFIVGSLLYFYICYKLVMTSYVTFFIGLVLCQIVLVVIIELARTIDESKDISLNRCYVALQNSIIPVLALAAFYVLMWVVAAKIATMFMFDSALGESFEVAPISYLQWLYPGTIGLFVVYIGIMVSTLWFLLPLSTFYKLPLVESMQLAKQGERMNFLVVVVASYVPFFAFFMLFIVSELALVVAIVGLPWFGIYLYVSFRHVYLGRKENMPELVKSVAVETQAT